MRRLVTIRRKGYFKQLMYVPERLYETIVGYFTAVCSSEEELYGTDIIQELTGVPAGHNDISDTNSTPRSKVVPTVPGLINYLGADRSHFLEVKDSDKHADAYPEESIHYIRQACLAIEDETIQLTVTGKGNPAFSKFLLSAYNGANEKTVSETTTNHNHLHITLAKPDSIEEGLGEQFRRESERLKGNTSRLVNKKIALGEIAETAREEISGEESGPVINVQFEEIDDDDYV